LTVLQRLKQNQKTEIKDLNPQSKFLVQISHVSIFLAVTKSKKEYFVIIKQLLQSNKNINSTSSSSSSSSSSCSVIGLADDNKDDYYDILPHIQNSYAFSAHKYKCQYFLKIYIY